MRRFAVLAAGATVILAALAPALAAPCMLQLGTRGTFHETAPAPDRCVVFEDVLGNVYEVANAKGAYREGLAGVAWAEFTGNGTCTPNPAIRICTFEGDTTKRVTGILELRNFIECPGYVITGSGFDYRIYNCEDFGMELCAPANLGRKIQAQLDIQAEISICLGQRRSYVVDYRFVD